MDILGWTTSIGHLALLLTAAFIAGALNAVAGGGSFLTLPALVFTGVPPVVANATGTVALLPGYMAGAWEGFREDMQPPPGLSMRAVVVLSLIGGSAGAALLLFTPDATFPQGRALAAAGGHGLLFAFGPQLRQWACKAGHGTPSALARRRHAGGGGLRGAISAAAWASCCWRCSGCWGRRELNAMNGMKNSLSALLTAIAVAIYAAGGIVLWPQALVMMVAATLGGYGGARVARQLPAPVLRWGIVATGLVMAGLFFLKG